MKTLYESGENYLEAILILKGKKADVHAIDVANYFSYSKASVSRAMKILITEGYIYINERGAIEFTESGKERAEKVYERHALIKTFLIDTLGIGLDVAEEDACRIEHVISEETFNAIKDKIKK